MFLRSMMMIGMGILLCLCKFFLCYPPFAILQVTNFAISEDFLTEIIRQR